ncbi:MAG: GNAT family N-acetyltransferase [Arthrobacter sp.]|uniref:GNAT family N-acetyltransferase n=1 Tax=unclassified Arthrobacter TaxID=235627 RepID=UPI002651DC5D|nr:GNAT family N-acetyltransferase [Micrococcaceae bacterium]MDN5811759.1 GNAT family N-acetyltransferase [Micrococcaceae bacterium]MDN5824168.1 GNAT family N-acetyltransferase [Micrococcaceae bacterium]MDN5878601.1 GNAT family N-acetyltransferase [Micrococcaceae bacterium]MDN5886162.1 GNAT family N-acetyltransferase [Micrococcaceae bacterium]
MMHTQVRRAMTEDWQALRAVRLRALADAPSLFSSTWERESAFGEERWRERAEQSNWFLAWSPLSTGLATQLADGLAGTVLRPGTGGCELIGMWVDPAVRGLHVGRELVAAAAGWARRADAGRLDLWVVAGNHGGHEFYRRQGFLETGEHQEVPDRPGVVELGLTLPLI